MWPRTCNAVVQVLQYLLGSHFHFLSHVKVCHEKNCSFPILFAQYPILGGDPWMAGASTESRHAARRQYQRSELERAGLFGANEAEGAWVRDGVFRERACGGSRRSDARLRAARFHPR